MHERQAAGQSVDHDVEEAPAVESQDDCGRRDEPLWEFIEVHLRSIAGTRAKRTGSSEPCAWRPERAPRRPAHLNWAVPRRSERRIISSNIVDFRGFGKKELEKSLWMPHSYNVGNRNLPCSSALNW